MQLVCSWLLHQQAMLQGKPRIIGFVCAVHGEQTVALQVVPHTDSEQVMKRA